MRLREVFVVLLLLAGGSGQRVPAATAADPFTIDRNGTDGRAAASLALPFRIETTDQGFTCSRWRVMTLVKASDDLPWQLVRSTEAKVDVDIILHGIPGQATLTVAARPGRPPGYSLYGPRVWGLHYDATEVIHIRRRRTVRAAFNPPSTSSRPDGVFTTV